MEDRREIAADALVLAVAHVVACTLVRVFGFDHVSDDDFARVTIAQSFVHSPRLDPSGTSWLPAPFWLLGCAMSVLGRSLEAARTFSIVFASAAFATPYLAMRAAGTGRLRALAASTLMLGGAWSIWLGASTVPESMCASLVAAGVLGIGTHHRVLASGALLVACLSRYEAWPAAALAAGWLAIDRERRKSPALLLCALGPLAWMAWNIHAHGDALHFFHRVASYKRKIGEPTTSPLSALLLYPRLLVTSRPDVAVLAGLALARLRDREVRARWLLPLLAALGQIAFLAIGATRDGAPTHHPERALLGTTFLLAAFAADAVPWKTPYVRPVAFCIWLATFVLGIRQTPPDDRRAQIARGVALRGASALVVTPCAYEHFALIAAFGAPERVTIEEAVPGAPSCPAVSTR